MVKRSRFLVFCSVTALLACVLTAAGADLRLIAAVETDDAAAVRTALKQGAR
jgi:hypothetical protein